SYLTIYHFLRFVYLLYPSICLFFLIFSDNRINKSTDTQNLKEQKNHLFTSFVTHYFRENTSFSS
ncbi:MAG: hypothetical protein KAG95_06210, partial [Bacteroidales bacterium]|nr:hypothetical protein [Bacteroidales bacterium]